MQLLLQHIPFPVQDAPVGRLHCPRFPGVELGTVVQQTFGDAHATQVAPPVPQRLFAVPGWQTPFWQQPVGHVVAPQTLTQEPFWHCVPVGQATQVTPFVPQAWFVFPG